MTEPSIHIALTDEQSMLRDMLAGYLRDHYGFEARRQAAEAGAGWRPETWKAFAEELGILGASFAEACGGLGGGAVENMIIMEQLGESLVLEPYLATVVIAGGLLKRSAHPRAAELIADIIAGRSIYAFAHLEPEGSDDLGDILTSAEAASGGWILDGSKAVVLGAPWATHYLVTARASGGGVSLFVVDRLAAGISARDYRTIDGGRASDLRFERVELPSDALIGEEGAALPLLERAVDEAIAAVAAEACGIMRRLCRDTIDYARERKQFGQAISEFQVLRHRMVDMFLETERSAMLTQLLTASLDADDGERARLASAAKVQVGRACRFVGQSAIQIHGGIGVTDELAVSHYFRRATMIEGLFGSVDHHLERYERLAFPEA